MSLQSHFEAAVKEFDKCSQRLSTAVRDLEKRARELPNEIAALEKQKQAAEAEYAVKLDEAKAAVAYVHKHAAETESIIKTKLEQYKADKEKLDDLTIRTNQLMKQLEAKQAQLDKAIADVDAQKAIYAERMKKLDSLKTEL